MNYLDEGISFLKQHNVPNPEISASSLLSYVLDQPVLSPPHLYLYPLPLSATKTADPSFSGERGEGRMRGILNSKINLTADQEKEFESLLLKRAGRYPLQYLLKWLPFRNAILEIGPGCLIPRPETELLVEFVLNKLGSGSGSLNILDIGTGSGNIAISLAVERPLWTFTATDSSDEALQYARKNSVFNHTNHQIHFIKADLFNDIKEMFDVMISNPPYVKTQDLMNAQPELSYEPAAALDGGEDGLFFYRRIIQEAKLVLKPGGHIFFEVGYDQAKDVSHLMKDNFEEIEIVKDYAGHERIICGRYVGYCEAAFKSRPKQSKNSEIASLTSFARNDHEV